MKEKKVCVRKAITLLKHNTKVAGHVICFLMSDQQIIVIVLNQRCDKWGLSS